MQAAFALAGHQLIIGQAGDFTVCRWGLCRYCANWEALLAFAKQVGVRNA